MATIPPPLIGALVRRPADAVHLRLVREAREAGYDDLVLAHMAVLRYPGPEGRRPSEIAAEAGVSKQAMNYLLGQLEQLGYVTRSEDSDDQRSRRVHLTKRGEELAKVLRRIVTRIEAELSAELGADSYAQLRELLLRLNDTKSIRAERNTP